MKTNKSLNYILRAMTLAVLSSPFTVLTPAEAIPPGVPRDRCGTLSNPQAGSLCYTVTPGGGKVNAGSSDKDFPSIIIQATEPEYVIAEVILEITSDAGDRNLPSVSQLSSGGQASIVSVARDKLRELKQIRGDLQGKATVLSGPALLEAQAKISALQEEERTYEKTVTATTAAGQDAGKFKVDGASARSRKCGTFNLDTCGSWVEYNVYTVKRYVGNPIAAYNRAFAVAQNAETTINRLIAEKQQAPAPAQTRFAAIANSQTANKFGMSWSATTREEAEFRAIQDCKHNVRQGLQALGVTMDTFEVSNCRVINWVSDAFLALAEDDERFWSTSGGNTDAEAREKALEACRKGSRRPNTCRITFETHTNGKGVGLIPLKGVVLAGS